MKKILKKAMENFPKNFIMLALLSRESYQKLNVDALKLFVEKFGSKGTYVTMNQPFQLLSTKLKNHEMDLTEMKFVDLITEKKSKSPNCSFIGAPRDLEKVNDNLGFDSKFLVIDSIDKLSFYHGHDVIADFMKATIQNLKKNQQSGLIMAVADSTDVRVVDKISSMCDQVISL